ncbi:MAG: GIY-YIG nuclease family protein [Candidatus Kerfeldbacteria bacterium]|nr:GIY-YIG nuclease family protein [Candidatus Kerfeldbacteria bacterium]
MWIVYVIQHTLDQRYYVGITHRLRDRIAEHNRSGKHSTQRKEGQWVLIYAEAFRSKTDASIREHRLKHHGSAFHELKRRISNGSL